MTRRLVLMGSGETTPTMVETHKRVFSATGGDRVLLDTPYGFQENRDEITSRALAYFARNTGAEVRAIGLPRPANMPAAEVEVAVAEVEAADWVFAGPGSPTYLLRQWSQTRLPTVLRERLDRPGAMVFASAAVCALGTHAIPVYEIYKVGADPAWVEGLDVMAGLGLRCVTIPHFDNAEGGTHDTRFCYLGETRLARLEGDLPDDVWVLGIDEHTALVADLDSGDVVVEGRGAVTVRARGRTVVVPAGSTTSLAQLQADGMALLAGGREGPASPPRPTTDSPPASTEPPAHPLAQATADLLQAFDGALQAEDGMAAARHLLDLEEAIQQWGADTEQSSDLDDARDALRGAIVRLARIAQAGLHDHRDLVAPHVETLLDLRDSARADRDWPTADRIRDSLVSGGVEVQDTDEGTEWDLRDDL